VTLGGAFALLGNVDQPEMPLNHVGLVERHLQFSLLIAQVRQVVENRRPEHLKYALAQGANRFRAQQFRIVMPQ
jgi:hypothetical protein